MMTNIMALLIVFGLIAYIMLDGFDLGTGIIAPFVPPEKREPMINSTAPFWHGNESWFIYSAGLLYAAFPMLYWSILPALYIPLFLMLFCLVIRGASFEFRLKSQNNKDREKWEIAFSLSSIGTAFFQGTILGSLLSGIQIVNKHFAGNMLDFLTPLSLICGLAVTIAYATLGTAWQIYKMPKEYIYQLHRVFHLLLTILGMLFVFILPVLHFQRPDITNFIVNDKIRLIACIILSTATIGIFHLLYTQKFKLQILYFIFTATLLTLPLTTLLCALYPYAIPFTHTLQSTANTPDAMKFAAIITGVTLPIILCYTGYIYFVFRGKDPIKTINL